MTVEHAMAVMEEAHRQGMAVVVVVTQEQAEVYCDSLRNNGLIATIEPESGGGGGDDGCDC